MNGWLKGWMASESANQDKIEVKRIYIDLNEGNLYDGVMFSQIMYWHGVSRETGKPRMSIERDGYLWLVKGYGDWWEECRIIEPTARASINRMAERGLIVKKLWKFNGAPTLHIRIDWDSLEEQLMWLCDDVSNGFDSKYQIGIDMSYQNDLTPNIKSLTDTTSDTTSDKSPTKKQSTGRKDFPVDVKKWSHDHITAFYKENKAALDALTRANADDMRDVPHMSKQDALSVIERLRDCNALNITSEHYAAAIAFTKARARQERKTWTWHSMGWYIGQYKIIPLNPAKESDTQDSRALNAALFREGAS